MKLVKKLLRQLDQIEVENNGMEQLKIDVMYALLLTDYAKEKGIPLSFPNIHADSYFHYGLRRDGRNALRTGIFNVNRDCLVEHFCSHFYGELEEVGIVYDEDDAIYDEAVVDPWFLVSIEADDYEEYMSSLPYDLKDSEPAMLAMLNIGGSSFDEMDFELYGRDCLLDTAFRWTYFIGNVLSEPSVYTDEDSQAVISDEETNFVSMRGSSDYTIMSMIGNTVIDDEISQICDLIAETIKESKTVWMEFNWKQYKESFAFTVIYNDNYVDQRLLLKVSFLCNLIESRLEYIMALQEQQQDAA